MEELSDKNLIEHYIQGDTNALDILIQKYLKIIYSFVYNNVGDQAAAEDITQEVFVKIWKNIKKFDVNKNFKPWLFQIAKNTSIDYLRKKKSIPFSRFENEKGQNVLLETVAADDADFLDALSDKKVLIGAVQGLNEKEQQLINLRYTDGLSFQEIADALKESINTVKSRYRRALANMNKNIKR